MRSKTTYKKLPFSLDRSRYGDLAAQIATGLRTAIETGYYKPGEVLPPVRDLGEILGVSMGIAVQAMAMIREEGLISPRPRVGSVVCPKDQPLWKGQVLIIVFGGDTIRYETMMAGVVRDVLTDAGYLTLTAAVRRGADGNPDFSLLEAQLRQQIDLVVQLVGTKDVSSWLSRKNVPFISVSGFAHPARNCVGLVRRQWDRATADFVAHCHERKARSVLVVSSWRNTLAAAPALKRVGITAGEWRLPLPDDAKGVKVVADVAMEAFSRRLAREGRCWLPDVLLFADDNLTTGALQALLAEGIRIPEDVAIATWANRWEGPTFVKPFTRLEMDAFADGELVAFGALEYLSKGTFPDDVAIGPAYIRGKTF